MSAEEREAPDLQQLADMLFGYPLQRCPEHSGGEPVCGSRALRFAVDAGFPQQMAYSLADTSAYTGVPVKTLVEERNAGRISFLVDGRPSKAMVDVREVDRWMDESFSS